MNHKSYEDMKEEFVELYSKKIAPRISEYSKYRIRPTQKTELENYLFYLMIIVFFVGIIISIYLSINNAGDKITGMSILLTGLITAILALLSNTNTNKRGKIPEKTNYENELKREFMDQFLRIFAKKVWWNIGLARQEDVIKRFRNSNIFSPFLWALFEDTITLTFDNNEINIYEVDTAIFNKTSRIWIPLCLIFLNIIAIPIFIIAIIINLKKLLKYSRFHGIVIECKFNKKFNGHTFFVDKSTNLNKFDFDKKIYEKVKLESVNFLNKYNLFSTDQVEARYVLTTLMIKRLEELKFIYGANQMRCSFKDNSFLLAIPVKQNMFYMDSDSNEAGYQSFKKLFNEIISILKIIDELELI